MKNIVNFTKEVIENLPLPPKNRIEYRDQKIPELCLRVTPTGIKSFSVHKRVNGGTGKLVRVTLGKFPSLSPTIARRSAINILGQLARGVNPKERQETNTLSNITLQEAFDTTQNTVYRFDSMTELAEWMESNDD